MKLKPQPENPMEWMALRMNVVPTPLVDTQIAFSSARAIMAAAELGIYEALGKNERTAEQISAACKTNTHATKQLLNCLVGIGYLQWKNEKYALRPKYYKWLLQESETNMIGKLRFQLLEWNWMAELENYVRTGKALQLHSSVNEEEWKLYQEGMRDLALTAARDVARKIPVPKNATTMLDIGGSHGLYSIELCKKHPGLKSTVLELPGAMEAASAIARRYDKNGDLTYQAGNALADDLGTEKYDVVMINNVVHHFTPEQNELLAKKIAKALKPGGIYIIGELIRADKPGGTDIVAATTGLYFSVTSASGNWSEEEMSSWQENAGLKKLKSVASMNIPGWKMVIAKKTD
jgi:2-polyprenyl-3-methyl-5-hydroxy-6-metoxy-1,4-benzoquinol methylase